MERFEISEATQEDSSAIKSLMLSALQTDPTAFSTDYSDYASNSDFWWQNYLFNYVSKNNAKLFLAKENKQAKAMVGVLFDSKNRRKHVASIVWFYVAPDVRGNGIGNYIFNTLLKDIKSNPQIKKINLLVNAPQTKAIQIYTKYGFSIAGTLKKELLINNQFIDEYIMEMYL